MRSIQLPGSKLFAITGKNSGIFTKLEPAFWVEESMNDASARFSWDDGTCSVLGKSLGVDNPGGQELGECRTLLLRAKSDRNSLLPPKTVLRPGLKEYPEAEAGN